MPLHEYHCPECETNEERLVSLHLADDQYCQKCGTALVIAWSTPAKTKAGRYGKGNGGVPQLPIPPEN